VTGVCLPSSVPSVLKAFPVRANKWVLRVGSTLRVMYSAVQKLNHGNNYALKSEFALTGRGLRKYKKLYLKTVPRELAYL
jgi:hypothetical protein